MKTIEVRKNGNKVSQFIVTDASLKIAKRLGISEKQFITERAKIELAEKETKK